jgi:ATP-dependent NAD(P)H-hydrate dehydratase
MYFTLWINLEFVLYGLQDGLFLVTNNIGLVEDNPLAILTPNVYEYKRLVQKVLNCEVNEENASEQLTALCQKIGGVTIMRKGKADLISDGKKVTQVSTFGSPRRCGGQGDILSGRYVAFLLLSVPCIMLTF